MRSIRNIGLHPQGLPLAADDITEVHASRLLLLLLKCGTANRIEGLLKLAKLDFLVRYPAFFEKLARHMGDKVTSATSWVESPMIRHHYGPWDKRYYKVLPYLESRKLITVAKKGNAYVFELTAEGKSRARVLTGIPVFEAQVEQMKRVKNLVGRKSGTTLKNLIYAAFDSEIARKQLGETIE